MFFVISQKDINCRVGKSISVDWGRCVWGPAIELGSSIFIVLLILIYL